MAPVSIPPERTDYTSTSSSAKESVSDFTGVPPFPSDIPTAPLLTLSLSSLLSSPPSAKELSRFNDAARGLGFFYLDLRGCEIGEQVLRERDEIWEVMRGLYELPEEDKIKFDFSSPEKGGSYMGYKRMGSGIIGRNGERDRNEYWNISKDDLLSSEQKIPTPDYLTKYRSLLGSYATHSHSILTRLLEHLGTVLSLPSTTFPSIHRLTEPSGDHIRMIRAPPQPPTDLQTALGEHTDFGSLTLLMNKVGGLQVQLPEALASSIGVPPNDWVYVRPMPGCAIVNLGDAMVKFSAGLYRSNIHRVVSPPGQQARETRYSLVFFMRPEDDVKLTRVKGGEVDTVPVAESEKAEPISSKDWIKRRALGRREGHWKGAEDWDKTKGTEGVRGSVK